MNRENSPPGTENALPLDEQSAPETLPPEEQPAPETLPPEEQPAPELPSAEPELSGKAADAPEDETLKDGMSKDGTPETKNPENGTPEAVLTEPGNPADSTENAMPPDALQKEVEQVRESRDHPEWEDSGPPRESPPSQQDAGHRETRSSRPVAIYILLLFTVALLLIALSSLMHQRNNTEAIGRLQSTLSNIRDISNYQERLIELQEARQDAEDQLRTVQSDLLTQIAQTTTEHNRGEALLYLYRIEMAYHENDYWECQALISELEGQRLMGDLPTELEDDNVIPPLERYMQLREAVENHIAELRNPPPAPVIPDIEPEPETPPETTEETGA